MSDLSTDMDATIAELEARLAEAIQDRDSAVQTMLNMREQREAFRDDAERYRWLRDRAGNAIMRELMGVFALDEWDRLIDAARAADSADIVQGD